VVVPVPQRRSAAQLAAPWLALCIPLVSASEGVRYVAYRDPVGIPTICFGETFGVQMGDRATPIQCNALLQSRLIEFGDGVDKCTPLLPPARKAAVTSFAYNVGLKAYCTSTLARKMNAGDPNACQELMRWVKAGPMRITLPGLVTRRKRERALCEAA
jgi:lysozyme